jgi:hypothetical protein
MLYQLGGLSREYHHIADRNKVPVVYEPTMVILNERMKGRSFHIPQEAMWKYIEPKDNQDAIDADQRDFNEIIKAINERFINLRVRKKITPKSNALAWDEIGLETWQLQIAMRAADFAMKSAMRNKMLLCLVFNLSLCLQIFEITVSGDSMAQLLMFIQDGLDELKNMAPLEPEKGQVAGEATMYEGTTKIGTSEVRITDTELITEHSETEGSA